MTSLTADQVKKAAEAMTLLIKAHMPLAEENERLRAELRYRSPVSIPGHSHYRPDLHHRDAGGYRRCDYCLSACHDGAWCVCCAAAEVEFLQARAQQGRGAQR